MDYRKKILGFTSKLFAAYFHLTFICIQGMLFVPIIDVCNPSPCKNGICVDEIESYTCNCSGTGFSGKNCETDIDECFENNPCKNRGLCINKIGTYECICSGFSGTNCDIEIEYVVFFQ